MSRGGGGRWARGRRAGVSGLTRAARRSSRRCGTYRGGAKKGRSKAGFGKHVVKQVDKFAADVGRRAHFTLEGRDPGMVFDSDGLANPSWYFYK